LFVYVKNLAPLVPLGPSVILFYLLLLLYHCVHLGDCVLAVVAVAAVAAAAAVEVLLLLMVVVVLLLLVQSSPNANIRTAPHCTSERYSASSAQTST
jgi:hypothetical protein